MKIIPFAYDITIELNSQILNAKISNTFFFQHFASMCGIRIYNQLLNGNNFQNGILIMIWKQMQILAQKLRVFGLFNVEKRQPRIASLGFGSGFSI